MSEQQPGDPVTERLPPPPIAGMPVRLPDLRRRSRSGPDPAAGLAPNVAGVHGRAYTRGKNRATGRRATRHPASPPTAEHQAEADRVLGYAVIFYVVAIAVLLILLGTGVL